MLPPILSPCGRPKWPMYVDYHQVLVLHRKCSGTNPWQSHIAIRFKSLLQARKIMWASCCACVVYLTWGCLFISGYLRTCLQDVCSRLPAQYFTFASLQSILNEWILLTKCRSKKKKNTDRNFLIMLASIFAVYIWPSKSA